MLRLRPIWLLSLLALAATAAFVTPPPPVEGVPDWRFGLIESYEAPQAATEAGAAWTRVLFHWKYVEAEGPEGWQPPLDEGELARELADGRQVVGLLIGVPEWAADEAGLPRGLRLPPTDTHNLWAGYVRRAVERYRGRIDHWIIWNEPDIWDKEALGHTWQGTVADFAQLQRVAYLVAKEANPEAMIHLSAFTYFWDVNYGREPYFSRLLAELAADPQASAHHFYFDVASAHLYFQPERVYDLLQLFREMMAAHDLTQPIWLVETNAPPTDDPYWPVSDILFQVQLYEQAAFIPQTLSLALAAGAERVAVYKLKDLDSDAGANPEPFGLVRRDGSHRPAFDTYRVAVRYLAGARSAERLRWDEVGRVRLDQGAFTTDVLFARLPAPQSVTVEATGAEAVLVDMWGIQQTLTPRDGTLTVDLPGSACGQVIGSYCMIGGTTYYLVQAAPGGSLPASLPAPQPAPTATPLPTPVPPTATPLPPPVSPTPTATPSPTRQPPAATPTAPALAAAGSAVQRDAVTGNRATVAFPDTVTFSLELAAGSEFEEAVLTYDVVQRSCVEVSSQVPLEVEDDEVEWTWVMSRSGNPPPGSEIWWEWTLTDGAGNSLKTPRQSLVLEDERFSWQRVSGENIALHWYEGEAVGPLLLDAALAGRQRLEEDLGIPLEDEVTFYIYGDAADMREAVLYTQEWAGGLAFSAYNTILIGVPPASAEGWGRDTVRHELAHLVLGRFGWSCLGGSRPSWLEEGLAMYAEGLPDETTRADVERGLEADTFFPLRSLNGAFPAHSSEASMAYSQSYSVVAFLLERYGQERLQQLLLTLAEGRGYDEALVAVYGFNVDGLETAWREALGAPPRPVPPTATPLRAAAVPTVVPLAAAEDRPTPAGMAPPPGGQQGPGICALGLLPLFLLGLAAVRSPARRKDSGTPLT